MRTLRDFRRRYVYPLWRWYLAGLLFLVITNIIQMEIPRVSGEVVNTFKVSTDTGLPVFLPAEQACRPLLTAVWGMEQNPGRVMVNLSLKLILFGLMLILFRILSRIGFYWPGRRFEASSRSDLFAKMMRLPVSFFIKRKVGDLVSRIANDTGYMRVLFAFGALAVCNMLLGFGFTISRMTAIHPGLTLFSLLPFAFMLVYIRFALPRMHRYSLASQKAVGNLTGIASEAFAHIHVIQAGTAQDSFLRRIEEGNRAVYDSNIRLMVMETVVFPMISFLANVGQFVVLFYGGSLAIRGALTVGDIVTFNLYIVNLAFPLSIMGAILAIYQRAKAAMQRIAEVEETPEETQLLPCADECPEAPLLEVRGLSFRYPGVPDGDSVLKDICFSLEEGGRIGIFGTVGSGKSTLFDAITRLYDPPAGTVFLKGGDVLAFKPGELRKRVAYAQQNVFLFSDTIRSNICFGMGDVPQDRVEAAARAACVLDEIRGFEHGWETQIGEKGIRLSGGQKQRLALARIFLREPELLILDDVLSAVDHTTEQRLIRSIGKTRAALLIASHRSSVLKICDEILIFDGGRIVDRGSFTELTRRHKHLYEEFNVEPE